MSLLALSAPATYISDFTLAGTALPASETAVGANTGFTVVNSPEGLVVVRLVVGASGAGNATFVGQNGNSNKVVAVSNSTVYILGPFDPAVYSNSAGLVQCNLSVTTGNSVGAYLLPALHPFATMRALHNPFEMTPGAADR